MTGYSNNDIAAAMGANPILQDLVVKMIMDPTLLTRLVAYDSTAEMRLIGDILSTNIDLQKHVAGLVGIARSEDVALRRLDAAETLVIDATRKVKHAALQAWASNQAESVAAREEAGRTKGLHKDQKKTSIS